MKRHNLCFLGFGHVGRALARLLVAKSRELQDHCDIHWRTTGIASRTIGWLARSDGFSEQILMSTELPSADVSRSSGIDEWLHVAKPSVVFETTSLNPLTGQPAIDYLRAVLRFGAHAITANKGTVVHAFDELSELARSAGKHFYFESTVMDSTPLFSLFRETLPGVKLRGFTGILNSTANVVIETMEAGRPFEEGIATARDLGITETDASYDIDGVDAMVKVCALATVLMRIPLKAKDVRTQGIRSLTPEMVQAARAEGRPFKLVARASLTEAGSVNAVVRPEQLAVTDALGTVRGTSLAVHFELDTMPGLTIISHRPNLQSTAYGLLADFVNAVR